MGYRKVPWRGVAVLAVAAVAMAACSSSKSSSSVATSGTTGGTTGGSGGCTATIGFFGALTGPNSPNLGINERNGVKLAISQFMAANPNCKISEKDFDSQGDPAQAPALAQKAIEDSSVTALIGPAFSGESKVADPIFEQGTLPNMTVSATGVSLGTHGWKYWHRAVGNDNSQGPAAAQYLSSTLNAKKVAVIDDGSEYGKGIADIVRTKLKAAGVTITDSESIDPKGTDFSSTVNNIKGASPDAVFYGGYYQQAGIILKEMRDAGLTAKFMGPDGTEDPGLIKAAGAAQAEGAILLAPGTPGDKLPPSFASAYQKLIGQAPGLYSVEAFDAANSLLQGIKAGSTTRAAMETYLSTVDYKGLSVEVKFSPTTSELASQVVIWASQVKGGQ
ncbi:MAG TPA: branched-chain amino acid ABC transporter substrate-binding protein, partial [Acidimicrobiales bacterium]